MRKFFKKFFKKEELPVLKTFSMVHGKMKNPEYLTFHIAEATPRGKLRFFDEIKRRL